MKKLIQNNPDFSEILRIIHAGRARAFQAVNTTLIETYWAVGEHLSRKVAEAGWGKGVVKELAGWLVTQAPDVKGFSAQNLWRMKQFYEVYSSNEKLSALPRVLSWTHYCLTIIPQTRHGLATKGSVMLLTSLCPFPSVLAQ